MILGYQKRTSKAKKNTRKSVWQQKVSKQATRAIFLAKYLLSNKPEDPSVEKLMNRMRDEEESAPTQESTNIENSSTNTENSNESSN